MNSLNFICLGREPPVASKDTPSWSSGSGGHPIACKDLEDAVRTFQKCGAEALVLAGGERPSWGPLWNTACDLVSAVLLGIQEHLPDLRPEIDLREGGVVGSTEVVSIAVRFGDAPIVGEVATLSRCCYEVRLGGPLRFALRRPAQAAEVGRSQPLVLQVAGLDLPNLRDVTLMRDKLASLLGSDFDRKNAYAWWQEHKDEEYPLESSKFHRMYESLFGAKTTQLLPRQIAIDALWGYLHNPGCSIQSFSFHKDYKARGVTITATRVAPKSMEEAALVETCRQISHTVLRENRTAGEKFATSTTNFCAMLYGHEVNQAGAKAPLIVKLFSAAKWWGPGDDGFHKYDNTWTVKDKRNKLGILVEEQGRIIWRLGAAGDSDSGDPAASKRPGGTQDGAPRRATVCCCRRRR